MSLLEVHNISHQYGDKILYKNASFECLKANIWASSDKTAPARAHF